jgi:hypothetical protein
MLLVTLPSIENRNTSPPVLRSMNDHPHFHPIPLVGSSLFEQAKFIIPSPRTPCSPLCFEIYYRLLNKATVSYLPSANF